MHSVNQLSKGRFNLEFEVLEPRLLLSADPVIGAAAALMVDPAGYADPSLVASLHDLTTTDPRTASAGTSAPMSAPAPLSLAIAAALSPSASDDAALDLADPVAAEPVQSVELVFVDERTPDYEQLLAGIGPGIAGQSTVVIMLEADRDGIEQISEALAAYDAVDVVHVVSHGRDGGVQLGATWLDADTLGSHAAALAGWDSSLTDGADLLFYGCKLAETADGRALTEAIAAVTGADVAASDDLTGAAALGGDWVLEHRTGEVESGIAFSSEAQSEWMGLLAAPTPAAGETLANATVTGGQTNADVAVYANGDYVVAWVDHGAGDDLMFRRFNADGTAKDVAEVAVSAPLSTGQKDPSIAVGANGNFVISWASVGAQPDIYAAVFDSAGNEVQGEFAVNDSTAPLDFEDGSQHDPDVAMDDNGNFVVTWAGAGETAPGTSDMTGIWGRRFDDTGTALGTEFQVHDTTASNQSDPSIAMRGTGEFAIAYTDAGGNHHVDVAVYEADGDIDFRFVANASSPTGAGAIGTAAIAMDSAGAMVVTWDKDESGTLDYDIFHRVFDATGTAIDTDGIADATANDVQANTETGTYAADTPSPAIAMDSSGNYVITWNTFGFSGTPVDADFGIGGREYTASGSPRDVAEFHVNTSTTGAQDRASVAMTDDGDFVVVWDGNGTQAGNVDDDGVFFQRYASSASVNVAPTIDLDSSGAGAGFGLTYTEGDLAKAIADTDTDIVDVDSTSFANVKLSIGGLLDGNSEELHLDGDVFALASAVGSQDTFGGLYTVSVTVGAGTADFTITKQGGGSFTELEAETLVEANQYRHADGDNPSDGDRTIDVTVNDGSVDSAVATSTINVDPENDAATLNLDVNDSSGAGGNDYAFTYTEGGVATAIADVDTAVVDVDSSAFANVKLSVSGLLDGDDEELHLDGDVFTLASAVGSQDTFGGLYTVSVTVGAGTADLTITKQGGGSFTQAEAETLIEAIQYRHADGDNPSDGDRTIGVTVNDGAVDSAVATSTINVDPENDATTLNLDVDDSSGAGGNDYGFTYTEGDVATAIADVDTAVVDVDSTSFANVKLSVSGLIDGDDEELHLDGDVFALASAVGSKDTFGGLYTVSVTVGAGTADFTITKQGAGSFTQAEAETLIEAIQYRHADGDNPSAGDRTIGVTVNDGSVDSTVATSTINVDPENDAATLNLDVNDSSGAGGNDYGFTYTEGDAATAIADVDTAVVDVDSTSFANVKLSVSGLLDGDAEELHLDGDVFALASAVGGQDTFGGLYTVSVTVGAGTADLTITKQGGGTFTQAEAETLIEAIQYRHADGDNPSDGNRTIDMAVNDGVVDSAVSITTINVDPENDAATLDLDANDSSGAGGSDYSFTFTEGDVATAIADLDTAVVDVDSTSFGNVKLSIGGLLDGNSEQLHLDGDVFGLASAVGSQDTFGGLYTVSVAVGAGTADFTITKQGGGSFTQAEAETLIEAIQYRHADGDNPSDGDRTIDVAVNDGVVDSLASTTTVNVNAVDDAPVFTAAGPFAVAENAPFGTVAGNVDANDGDGGAADTGIIYSILANANPDGDANGAFQVNPTTGEITINDTGDLDFEMSTPLLLTVRADDGINVSDVVVTVNLIDVADGDPVFTASGPFNIDENSGSGTVIGDLDANDGDGGATDSSVTYSILGNSSPDGDAVGAVSVNPVTGVLSVGDVGDFDFENAADFTVTVRADDGVDFTDRLITVNVNDVDEAPVFTATGPFAIDENSAVASLVGDVEARDGDGGATDAGLTYRILSNVNPDGDGTDAFTIDASSGQIRVADTNDLDFESNATFVITVEADDGVRQSTVNVTVNVGDQNEAPRVTLSNTLGTLAEDAAAGGRIKVADIAIVDDALGANTLSLAGADAALFEIDGLDLYLKAGASVDFATNPTLDVTVQVDDISVGLSPDDAAGFGITVTAVPTPPPPPPPPSVSPQTRV